MKVVAEFAVFVKKYVFSEVPQGPKGVPKVQEAGEINFLQLGPNPISLCGAMIK